MRRSNLLGGSAAAALALFAGLSCAAAQDLSTCGGGPFKRFVGKPVDEMRALRKAHVRYVCESCAATMDYSASRLTVVYADGSGLIKSMSCN